MKLIYSANSTQTTPVEAETIETTTMEVQTKSNLRILEIVFLIVALFSTATLFAQNTYSAVIMKEQDADMANIQNIKVWSESSATQMTWNVNNETKSCIYVIERAMDKENFLPISKVVGTPDEGVKSYTYTDNKPMAGTGYYRLMKIYPSGAYNFSDAYVVNENATETAIGTIINPTDH